MSNESTGGASVIWLQNLNLIRLGIIAVLLGSLPAGAATAILNAIAEMQSARELVVEFRAASAEGWKVSRAALFLHAAKGAPPKRVRVALVDGRKPRRMRAFEASPQPQGWVKVSLDAALVEAMAAGRGSGLAVEQGKVRFHGLDPISTQPYLIVEGNPR